MTAALLTEIEARPHCRSTSACIAKTPGKHCIACTSAIPEVRAKRSASIRAGYARDPEMLERKRELARMLIALPQVAEARAESLRRADVRERHRAGCRRAADKRMADPAQRQILVDSGRKRAAQGALAVMQTPEARAKAARSIRVRALAWCPEPYWPLNATLKRKGYLLPERKALIAAEIAKASPQAVARRQIEDFNRRQRQRVERERAQAY